MNIPESIKNHVATICSNIYESTYLGVLNKRILYAAIEQANKYGIMGKVREWYRDSKQYSQDLDSMVLNLFPQGEKGHIEYLLNAGSQYEQQYLSNVGNFNEQHLHIKCYNYAQKLYATVVKSPDFTSTYNTLCQANSNCLTKQTQEAFLAYFGDATRDNFKNSKSLTEWINSNFSQQANTLIELINSGESKYTCTEPSVLSQANVQVASAGDDKTENKTAVASFAGGSARKPIQREWYEKTNRVFYQSYDTSNTFYVSQTMSSLYELTVSSQQHSLFNCIYTQLQTHCDFIDQLANLFTNSTQVVGLTDETSRKLFNRTIYNQIGNRGLIRDNNNKAITRDKPTNETSTN